MGQDFISKEEKDADVFRERTAIRPSLYGENSTQSLIDNLEVAVYTCDARGYITMYNNAAACLWGRRPEIGRDLWCGSWKIYELDGITEISLDTCPMALTLKEGEVIAGREIVIEKPDGERRVVIPYPRPFLDKEGKITGAINLLVDVSSYKRIEQREAQLAAIVDSSDDAIVSKTLDGIVTSWNPGAEKIFGYSAAEMIGQPIFKIIPAERWDEEYYIQGQLRSGNKIDHYETRRVRKDGQIIEVSLTISPIRDKNGTIVGASKIARDITKQRAVTQALQESEERLRLAVETGNLGTWALDIGTMTVVCSTRCRAALGIDSTDEPVTLDELMAQVYPADVVRVRQALSEASDPDSNKGYEIEHRIMRRDDQTIRWLRVKAKMYFGEDGSPQKLLGTMLDITEEKASQERLERTVIERTEELQKTNERLQKSNHDLEQFAYIASHDLQEPLRKIQTYIGIIEESSDRDTSSIYFPKIVKSTTRMARLIKDVLDYSRVGKDGSKFTDIDLNVLLNVVMADYDHLIHEKNAVIKSSDLHHVIGIESQIRQLFANLLSNALKFCGPVCRITISSDYPDPEERNRHAPLDPNRSYLRLVFSDNGIGFEQQYAEKIFMIFQRLHSATEYAGTGIGLALCKKIVENHHGYITADSQPGHGATFTVWLPTVQQAG